MIATCTEDHKCPVFLCQFKMGEKYEVIFVSMSYIQFKHDNSGNAVYSIRKDLFETENGYSLKDKDSLSVIEYKDPVNNPSHYNSHPSGIECMDVVKHMNFCLGNAIKYIWRAGLKGDKEEDLKKAIKYLETEINMLQSKKV